MVLVGLGDFRHAMVVNYYYYYIYIDIERRGFRMGVTYSW